MLPTYSLCAYPLAFCSLSYEAPNSVVRLSETRRLSHPLRPPGTHRSGPTRYPTLPGRGAYTIFLLTLVHALSSVPPSTVYSFAYRGYGRWYIHRAAEALFVPCWKTSRCFTPYCTCVYHNCSIVTVRKIPRRSQLMNVVCGSRHRRLYAE